MLSKYLDEIAPFITNQSLVAVAIILTLMISLFIFKMRSNREFLYFILVLNTIFIVILGIIPTDRGVRLLAAIPLIDLALFGVGVFEFIRSVKAIIKYAPAHKEAVKNMSLGNYLSKADVALFAKNFCQRYKNHRLSKKATNDGYFDIKRLTLEEIYTLAVEEFALENKEKSTKK